MLVGSTKVDQEDTFAIGGIFSLGRNQTETINLDLTTLACEPARHF